MTTAPSDISSDAPPQNSTTTVRSGWLTPICGAMAGFAWFLYWGGQRALDPRNLEWIIGDHAQHLLGWLFFRNEPWALPLGTISGLPYPLGTTIGFTDANPWVSVLLKPFSAWLPVDFQFIGPWLAACFVLQGFFGAKIMQAMTPNRLHQVLGATIFALAPPMLQRIGHDTLAAHWLLLGLVWLHLREGATARNTLGWAFAFNIIAAGTHPYLAMMVLPLTLALFFQQSVMAHRIGILTATGSSIGVLAVVAATFWLHGYLGATEELSGGGFGFYSADALTLFNPMGYSRWLPEFAVGQGQYEGFGFLGSGVLALGLVSLVVAAVRRERLGIGMATMPLWLSALLVGIFAMSHLVTAAGYLVLTMRKFYEPLMPFVEPARSSGRFIWPLHYVVLTGVLALAVRPRVMRPAVAALLLAGAIALQAGEVRQDERFVNMQWRRLESPVWDHLSTTYQHLVLYPPYYAFGPDTCYWRRQSYDYDHVVKLSDFAYRRKMTFNSAYVARVDETEQRAYCRQLHADVAFGRFSPSTVYIVDPDSVDLFTRPGADTTCGRLDGYDVCVSNAIGGRFRQLLQQSQ